MYTQTEKYRGVIQLTENQWVVTISSKIVGVYDSEETAAFMYDIASLALYGDMAVLNFPDLELDMSGVPA